MNGLILSVGVYLSYLVSFIENSLKEFVPNNILSTNREGDFTSLSLAWCLDRL
jgi:hypothetical protein